MSIWSAPPRTNRSDYCVRTALLGFAAVFLLAACTSATSEDATPSVASSPPPTTEVLRAYVEYLSALTAALAAGDPAFPQLAERATGPALDAARLQLQANVDGGLIATGTIQPAATPAEVVVEGDRATVQDCLRNDLSQVRNDNPREVVQAANGYRHPLSATLIRGEAGWIVSEVLGPELRGPVPGGESCAPPALARTIVEAYEAFWDARYAAGDPGDGNAADPDAPSLPATMLDPQLSDSRAEFADLRDAGQVLRVRPDTAPVVLGVYDYDQFAVLLDCVIEPEGSGIYDLASGERVEGTAAGTQTLDTTEMRLDGATWKAADWDPGEDPPCTRARSTEYPS